MNLDHRPRMLRPVFAAAHLLKRNRAGSYAAAVLLLTVASGYAYAAPPTASHTVIIEALRYSPPTIEVNKGDTIVWRNKDPFPHTVTAQNRAFDSGQIAEGKSWKFKAKQSGEFTYICTLHPTMKGTLIVK